MAVSDYQSGKVVATLSIGEGVDGAGVDPGRQIGSGVPRGGRRVLEFDGGDDVARVGSWCRGVGYFLGPPASLCISLPASRRAPTP
jgi:hypothetical protein